MIEALRMAGVRPDEVGVIFANGDGRASSDAAEAHAIETLFGARTPVTATKAALGNTLAASAPLDTVLALLALQRKTAPPCCVQEVDPSLGLNLVRRACLPIEKPCALINVQGQSNQCASIVVKAPKE